MRSDGSCKSRKPYKITKPRERWSEDEHEKFLEAIDRCASASSAISLVISSRHHTQRTPFCRFGRNWKEIVTFVGTRSVSQVSQLKTCKTSVLRVFSMCHSKAKQVVYLISQAVQGHMSAICFAVLYSVCSKCTADVTRTPHAWLSPPCLAADNKLCISNSARAHRMPSGSSQGLS